MVGRPPPRVAPTTPWGLRLLQQRRIRARGDQRTSAAHPDELIDRISHLSEYGLPGTCRQIAMEHRRECGLSKVTRLSSCVDTATTTGTGRELGSRTMTNDDIARAILDAGVYVVFATADAEGVPWASPVWFAKE